MSGSFISKPWLKIETSTLTLRLYVQPKASRTEVSGEYGAGADVRLKIRVAAPPVDGEANAELIRFLRKLTGLPAASVALIRGETSRAKDIRLQGVAAERLVALLLGKTET